MIICYSVFMFVFTKRMFLYFVWVVLHSAVFIVSLCYFIPG